MARKQSSSQRITVENFMNDRMVMLDYQKSVADAARTMVENTVSSVVVTRDDEAVGIATERDVVKIAAKDVPLDGVTIGSLMSRPIVSISRAASVEEAAESMVKNRVRHLVVRESPDKGVGEGEIVGIMSASDIARYLKQKLVSREAESRLMEAIYPTETEGERLFW